MTLVAPPREADGGFSLRSSTLGLKRRDRPSPKISQWGRTGSLADRQVHPCAGLLFYDSGSILSDCKFKFWRVGKGQAVSLKIGRQAARIRGERLLAVLAGIAPRSVELWEASAAVNDVRRPARFEQRRVGLFSFRSEQQAQLVGPEVA